MRALLDDARTRRDLPAASASPIGRVAVTAGGGRRLRAAASRPAGWRCSRPTPSTGWPPSPSRAEGVRPPLRLKGRAARRARGGHVLRPRPGAGRAARAGRAHARGASSALLPGALTLLLPNPARRYPLACGPEPERLGLRVPRADGALAPLAAVRWPVLQSSANRAGGAGRAPARRRGRRASARARTSSSTAASCRARRPPSSTSTRYEADGAHASCARGRCRDAAVASWRRSRSGPVGPCATVHTGA